MSYEELDDIIHEAVLQERTVELTDAEGYGYQIEIDETPLVDGAAITHEAFGYSIGDVPIHHEASGLATVLLRDHAKRAKRNRMQRLRTADQCAAHGEVLPVDG